MGHPRIDCGTRSAAKRFPENASGGEIQAVGIRSRSVVRGVRNIPGPGFVPTTTGSMMAAIGEARSWPCNPTWGCRRSMRNVLNGKRPSRIIFNQMCRDLTPPEAENAEVRLEYEIVRRAPAERRPIWITANYASENVGFVGNPHFATLVQR